MSFAAESPPPSTEEVVAAIQTLYHGVDPKEKEAASRCVLTKMHCGGTFKF